MRTSPIAVAVCVLLAPLLSPGSAPAATLEPLVDAAPASVPRSFDRVLRTPAPRAAAAASRTRTLRTQDGNTVPVTLSASYTDGEDAAQGYVDFLGSLPHGAELSRLRITIATPAEVRAACGGGAGTLACYTTGGNRMIVPGARPQTRSGITASYIVAHEYGHHVAAFRSNAPFPALDFGPKRWASQQEVCRHATAGRLAPGDEDAAYRANPGEAWAETYAQLRYPAVRWAFAPILKPDAAAFAAARRDVLDPWTERIERRFRGRPGAEQRSVRHRFVLTLDGALDVRLDGPDGAEYDLTLSSLGKVRKRTRTAGADDRIAYDAACRSRPRETVTVTVRRRSGSGPYTLRVRYAG